MSVIYSARGISKHFGVVQALSGVDLDVVQGKVVGLVGANGAGKSTLLKIIACALPSDSGELRLDGEPLVMTSITHAAQAGIAIVSQELSLFPALSVEENLLLAPGGRDWKSRQSFARRAREILARLGVNVALKAPLHRLSLADRQLIEIARALLQNPRVLILDEPTSSLHAAWRQIRCRRGDGLDSRLLVVRDDRDRLLRFLRLGSGFFQDLDLAVDTQNFRHLQHPTRRRGVPDSSAPCAA